MEMETCSAGTASCEDLMPGQIFSQIWKESQKCWRKNILNWTCRKALVFRFPPSTCLCWSHLDPTRRNHLCFPCVDRYCHLVDIWFVVPSMDIPADIIQSLGVPRFKPSCIEESAKLCTCCSWGCRCHHWDPLALLPGQQSSLQWQPSAPRSFAELSRTFPRERAPCRSSPVLVSCSRSPLWRNQFVKI